VVGLFIGHLSLEVHLFKLGLTENLICERCQEKDESATYILCDCEAIAYLRLSNLGQFFREPNDYYDAPIQSPAFHSKCRIDTGVTRRGSTLDH
jgi:hypothetical protein